MGEWGSESGGVGRTLGGGGEKLVAGKGGVMGK